VGVSPDFQARSFFDYIARSAAREGQRLQTGVHVRYSAGAGTILQWIPPLPPQPGTNVFQPWRERMVSRPFYNASAICGFLGGYECSVCKSSAAFVVISFFHQVKHATHLSHSVESGPKSECQTEEQAKAFRASSTLALWWMCTLQC